MVNTVQDKWFITVRFKIKSVNNGKVSSRQDEASYINIVIIRNLW